MIIINNKDVRFNKKIRSSFNDELLGCRQAQKERVILRLYLPEGERDDDGSLGELSQIPVGVDYR